MAEAIALPLRGDTDVKKLLDLLNTPGYQSQRREYESLLDYVDTITAQYNTILTELDALKEKVSKITDRKNPLSVMVENLEALADNVGTKLRSLKDGIISFTKNALNTVKEKGMSALGAVFGALHVKDGLQVMSRGLAKSVEALDKTVTRVDNLEQHNREKAAVGQYQHGSAKWLTDKEKDKAFESFILDPNDEQVRELLRSGYDGLDFMKS